MKMHVRSILSAAGFGASLLLSASVMAQATGAAPAPASQPKAPEAKPAETKPAETKPAESKPAENLPPAKELHDKYIEALGGKAAMEKATTRILKGKVEVPSANLNGKMTMISQAPNKAKITQELPGIGKVERGTDGARAWEITPMGPRIIDGDELADFLRSSDVTAELNLEKYYTIKTVGKETLKGGDAYDVEMTSTRDKSVVHQFYDAKTGLLVKRAETVKSEMGDMATETTFEDYTTYGPLKAPKVSRQKVMGAEIIMTVEGIEFPDTLPADTFEPPAQIKELMDKAKAPAAKPGEPKDEKKTGDK